jgi:hypothetical protein
VATVQSRSLIFPCLVFFSPLIVSCRIFSRSCPGYGGCSGHELSLCFRNSGPLNHSFASFSLATVIPLVAASAGLIGPGTQRNCVSFRYCRLFNTLVVFFKKTTPVKLATQRVASRVLPQSLSTNKSPDVTNFFAKAKPISAANSSMRGIVKAAFIGFSLDFAWTNLSAMPNTDSILM